MGNVDADVDTCTGETSLRGDNRVGDNGVVRVGSSAAAGKTALQGVDPARDDAAGAVAGACKTVLQSDGLTADDGAGAGASAGKGTLGGDDPIADNAGAVSGAGNRGDDPVEDDDDCAADLAGACAGACACACASACAVQGEDPAQTDDPDALSGAAQPKL